MKENIEIYIQKEFFAEGHFHQVRKCKQLRTIEETYNPIS